MVFICEWQLLRVHFYMSGWPPNHYLDTYLRSDEGQRYLEKHGCLDAWRRRNLLDEIPVVANEGIGQDSFMLVPERRPRETLEDLAKRSVLVKNVNLQDVWDF